MEILDEIERILRSVCPPVGGERELKISSADGSQKSLSIKRELGSNGEIIEMLLRFPKEAAESEFAIIKFDIFCQSDFKHLRVDMSLGSVHQDLKLGFWVESTHTNLKEIRMVDGISFETDFVLISRRKAEKSLLEHIPLLENRMTLDDCPTCFQRLEPW